MSFKSNLNFTLESSKKDVLMYDAQHHLEKISLKAFIIFCSNIISLEPEEEFALCVLCGNPIERCVCVCPFCGERDKCECALFDAATGG